MQHELTHEQKELFETVRDWLDRAEKEIENPTGGQHWPEFMWGDYAAEAIAALETIVTSRW